MSMLGFVLDVRPLHRNSRCVLVDVIDVETGRVVVSDITEPQRADERALLMCDFVVERAGGVA